MPQGVRSFLDRAAERPWAALVELLLIGSVVYTVLRFLQGTRGARLVRAVLTILVGSFVVVWLVAERFGLDRINALYPYFVLGVFLVSLVAFQSELRRILLRVGEGRWWGGWLKGATDIIEPIVSAVEWCAKRKIGALIAVERGSEPGTLPEIGVPLDAVVSPELLETIFWPGTPLHDLGVIVHQGRVRAAGCQFPLAESGDVDQSLGSRHRAALGYSQETDVLVIVVSEETGAISIAQNGRLHRAVSTDEVRETLKREVALEPPGISIPRRIRSLPAWVEKVTRHGAAT
jgi:diadenylate cyclase